MEMCSNYIMSWNCTVICSMLKIGLYNLDVALQICSSWTMLKMCNIVQWDLLGYHSHTKTQAFHLWNHSMTSCGGNRYMPWNTLSLSAPELVSHKKYAQPFPFHNIAMIYDFIYIYMISYVCPSIFHICPYVSIYYFTCIFTDFHMIQDISGLLSHHFSRMTGLHLPHRGLQVVEQVQRHRPGRGLLTGADGGVVGGDGRLQPGWWNLWSGESWTNHPKMQDLFGISMIFLWSVHAKN